MNCDEAQEKIDAYLDRELEQQSSARLEAHLEQCKTCGDYLEARRQLVELLDRLPVPPVPSQLGKQTVDLMRRRMQQWRRSFQRVAAAVIICALAVGVAAGLIIRPEQQDPGAGFYENTVTSPFSVSPTGSVAETQLLEDYEDDELLAGNDVVEQKQEPGHSQPANLQENK